MAIYYSVFAIKLFSFKDYESFEEMFRVGRVLCDKFYKVFKIWFLEVYEFKSFGRFEIFIVEISNMQLMENVSTASSPGPVSFAGVGCP